MLQSIYYDVLIV